MDIDTNFVEEREGHFFIRGSRVSLASIVYEFLGGASPEAIRNNFPTLSPEQVGGSIAFYLRNQARIDLYLKASKVAYLEALHSQAQVRGDLQARLGAHQEILQP